MLTSQTGSCHVPVSIMFSLVGFVLGGQIKSWGKLDSPSKAAPFSNGFVVVLPNNCSNLDVASSRE